MHEELVRWFVENQRTLPWRVSYNPYHVWISEIMLQQTQVETVLPYFEKFVAAFPTPSALAAAPETQVMGLWAGLGYYSRARNLLAAARAIARDYDGEVPDDYETLRSLPGIGQYTAGAILSIAFNKPYPVVDGNVRRVLSRVYGWPEGRPAQLWEAAGQLAKLAEPRLLNQAIMELGAVVCSFRAPRCLLCPIRDHCAAFRTGLQESIPEAKKRPATVRVHVFAVVQQDNGRCLMRPAEGLWEFPMFGELPAGELVKAGTCRHTITHHRLEVSVYTGALENPAGFEWQRAQNVPVSSLTRKIWRTAETSVVPERAP